MIAVTTFAGRAVAVFGMARSGLAAARSLLAGGAAAACWDDGTRGREAAAAAGLPLVDLREADWSRFAALVLAPGVPLTHPEPHWTVRRAKAAGVEVIGDTELFFRELALRQEPARPKVVAITGTNGKSTTTALTAHLLRHAGQRVAMGGNIGEAVLGLAPLSEVDVYVLELSSYQIDLTPTLNADVGILLNLSPDHLDRHGTLEHYAAVKERLVTSAKTAVIGVEGDECHAMAMRRLDLGKRTLVTIVVEFLADDHAAGAAGKGAEYWSADASGPIRRNAKMLASLNDIETLRGQHNAQNAVAAFAACVEIGLEPKNLEEGLKSFAGLAHRMEPLGHLRRVAFVNDSKATNADSAAKALDTFGRGIHWILGGKPKEGGIESLTPFYKNVARAYLIGEASESFAKTFADHSVAFERCGDLATAVKAAAQRAGGGPATVLLSPACASFDQFKDFEDRGDQFRKLVAALPGFLPYGAKAPSS